MGKVIKKKIQGMSWWMKTSLVLLLTLATSVFMYEGLYKPMQAQAAITQLVAPTVVSAAGAPATASFATGTGTNRMLIVGVSIKTGTVATQTCTASYGGISMTPVPGTDTSATSAFSHTYWFYMLDTPSVMSATAYNLIITAPGTITASSVWRAVYTGVAQGVPDGGSYNSGTAAVSSTALTSGLVINSGDMAFDIVNLTRSASTTARTLSTWAAGWAIVGSAQNNTTTNASNVYLGTSTTVNSNDLASNTASNTTQVSASGIVVPMADVTAPVANNDVTSTPSSGIYTSSSPTITATFNEPNVGSSITLCEYTTNGSSWSSVGTSVSGTGPNYTCTVTPTGLTGALTINMRATSTGGGPTTSTAITRTVDVAPTDGALNVGAGYLENALTWGAATGAAAGINHYDVRYALNAAPANCSSGTVIYTGKGLNFTHTALTTGQLYGYLVCATSNVNNFSTGVSGTGTPVARASVVNSCGSCHGFPNTSNAFTDAPTTRGIPAGSGQFLGTHGTHAGSAAGQYAFDCTKCHISNTSLTHQTGTIQMAANINGDTGGKYGKGTSWPYTNSPTQFANCSAIYCHSNGTSVATGVIYTNISSPRWGTVKGCNVCHGTESKTRTAGAPWYPNFSNYSVSSPLSTGWTNPANALHEDNVDATYTAATQQPLVLSSFKHLQTLPAGVTITGISVAIKGHSPTSRTLNVAMTKTGNATIAGTAKTVALTPTNQWHVVNTVPNDLWGTTWTTTDILGAANTTFGIIVKDNAATTSDISIDAVRVTVLTTTAPKFNSHSSHIAKNYGCNKCHYATTTNGTTIADTTVHVSGSYSLVAGSGAVFTYSNTNPNEPTCSNVGCHSNAVWGVSKFDCVSCHSVAITRTVGAAAGLVLAPVATEFGLTYGHKKSGRGAVTAEDCVVCHLEGDGVTHKPSSYHQNGKIDLRDPQGAGETPIKDFAGTNFAFTRFSTSATRTSSRNSSDIAQVVSLQFCMMCHKKEGATNPTARSGAGTANSPWGSSTGYAANTNIGVPVANGTINVFTQFSSGNSSYHPVKSPLNRDYPIASRLVAPYNGQGAGRTATGNIKSLSVMLNCFDCHNTSGWTNKYRTGFAHGNNVGLTIGTFYAASPTACAMCHSGYTNAANHQSGSAMNGGSDGSEGFGGACNNCHSSSGNATAPARPTAAADFHGFNALVPGTTVGNRPFAFIRGWGTTATSPYMKPRSASDVTATTSGSCMNASSVSAPCGNVGNGSTQTYTPGGAY